MKPNTRKLFKLLSAIFAFPVFWDDSGNCGESLTWNYNSVSGTLRISGSGNMKNYCSNLTPWYDYRKNITSLIIEDGITSVGNYAFCSCRGLKSLTIGNGVVSIGDGAFSDCTGLTEINYNAKSAADLICFIGAFYNAGTSGGGINVKFGNNVERIPAHLFYVSSSLYRPNIKSVTIGKNVKSIGDYAFSCCDKLQYYEYDNALYLGNDTNNYLYLAKAKSKNISSCSINENTRFIGNSAFSGCCGLIVIEIPNSVTSIGNSAFSDCTGLTGIEMSNSITSIGNWAFENCIGLTRIKIPNSVTSIGYDAFSCCDKLQYYEYDNALYLGNDTNNYLYLAKAKSKNISSCSINENTRFIGCDAFYGCIGLISVTIPNSVKSIGYDAFYGCAGLTSIEIPNSVTSVGDYAFSGCCGLTSIEIPNSVISIGDYAFYGCIGLTSVTITKSVIDIGEEVFSGCPLESITVSLREKDVTNQIDFSGLFNYSIPSIF